MNTYNVTNIKDLPGVDQILDGDFLIVENPNGTSKIDFKDFVIGPSNTSFYTPLATDVLTLSSRVDQNTVLVNSISASTNTAVSQISSTVAQSLSFWSPGNLFYSSGSVTLNLNALTALHTIPVPFNLNFNGSHIYVSQNRAMIDNGDGTFTAPPLIKNDDVTYYHYPRTVNNVTTLNVLISTNRPSASINTLYVTVMAFIRT